MDWLKTTLDALADRSHWGYRAFAPPASEPVALAALALVAYGRPEKAEPALAWLLEEQNSSGSVGVFPEQHAPHWPTAWAVLAWQAATAPPAEGSKYAEPIGRATEWLVRVAGEASPRNVDLGHDTSLKGWPWVEGTHSWIEPTSLALLALKATGRGSHPRAREAVRLLLDRLLPEGGCNYGNTSVLGQTLRPQLEPTGLALLALAGESDSTGRLASSIAYARRAVGADVTSASLGYALMGLAAHDQTPDEYKSWLAAAAARSLVEPIVWPRLSLLALAQRAADGPLVQAARHPDRS